VPSGCDEKFIEEKLSRSNEVKRGGATMIAYSFYWEKQQYKITYLDGIKPKVYIYGPNLHM